MASGISPKYQDLYTPTTGSRLTQVSGILRYGWNGLSARGKISVSNLTRGSYSASLEYATFYNLGTGERAYVISYISDVTISATSYYAMITINFSSPPIGTADTDLVMMTDIAFS